MKIRQIPFFSNYIDKQRRRLSALQEASFEKSEKELKELLGTEDEFEDNFPVPGIFIAVLIWTFIIFFPLMMVLDPVSETNNQANLENMVNFYVPLFSMMLVFIANQRLLVKHFFFKKKYILYFVTNFCLLGFVFSLRELITFFLSADTAKGIGYFFSSYAFAKGREHALWALGTFIVFVFMICLCCILISVFTRQIIRSFIIREKKRSSLQNELDFLRQQLSPHFLFNTLNNISALISLAPQKAEKSMNELSSLLRITLYQTTDTFIPLSEEIEILKKYANLEKLRLDESYDLAFNIQIQDPSIKIAPLMTMPILENAMKHSINPNGKSFAHISIVQKDNALTIIAENSNFPRKKNANASGLGLATLKKRLELIYTGNYEYTTCVEDNIYKSILRITLPNE